MKLRSVHMAKYALQKSEEEEVLSPNGKVVVKKRVHAWHKRNKVENGANRIKIQAHTIGAGVIIAVHKITVIKILNLILYSIVGMYQVNKINDFINLHVRLQILFNT